MLLSCPAPGAATNNTCSGSPEALVSPIITEPYAAVLARPRFLIYDRGYRFRHLTDGDRRWACRAGFYNKEHAPAVHCVETYVLAPPSLGSRHLPAEAPFSSACGWGLKLTHTSLRRPISPPSSLAAISCITSPHHVEVEDRRTDHGPTGPFCQFPGSPWWRTKLLSRGSAMG